MAKRTAKDETEQQEQGELVDYNFPEYGVTVQARSTAEAEEKLQKLINE